MKNVRNVIVGALQALMITIFLWAVIMLSAILQGCKPSTANAQTMPKCKRCVELEQAIVQLIHVVRTDQSDYYLDVLCETDEWCHLDELLNDTTHHRVSNVFPDTIVKQAPK